MILRHCKTLATTSRPVPAKKKSAEELKRFAFYDLVLRTPSHPTHPIEARLMTNDQLNDLKKTTKTRFEGNYSIDTSISAEERIAKVFGGRIKGEDRKSSSRILRGEPRVIGGITVPSRPPEPDNCCMSGCINCVWELFEEDLKDWNEKRIEAANSLAKKGGRWPENFHPPLKHLKRENLPESLANRSPSDLNKDTAGKDQANDWGDVPIAIRVFTETEKKIKRKHLH